MSTTNGWRRTNEKRTVLAVRPINERTVQVVRKMPMAVECAVIVEGQAVRAFDDAPAWLQAFGRAANKVIFALANTQLEAWRARNEQEF